MQRMHVRVCVCVFVCACERLHIAVSRAVPPQLFPQLIGAIIIVVIQKTSPSQAKLLQFPPRACVQRIYVLDRTYLCVAVRCKCCSVLQRVAMCCSGLQC